MKLLSASASSFLLLNGGIFVSKTAAAEQEQENLPIAAAGKNPFGLSTCLKDAFGDDTVNYFGKDILPKVVFSPANAAGKDFNMESYNIARHIGIMGSSLPGAVLFAENTQDVKDGIDCAREFGYVVSPRGAGHSFQAISTFDGTLVIDMKLTCTIDNFEVVSREKGDGILPGSKSAGIIRAASGCTNAALLAAVSNSTHYNPSEGAMAVVGSCPSVGITGYVLGGGMGDVTPYAGIAADQVKAVDIVLFNGTEIKASPEENDDLYWAVRGGGGGFGVITNLYLQNIMSPSPTAFTNVQVFYKDDNKTMGEFAVRMQDFLYFHSESAKYGGAIYPSYFKGIYLGPWEEAFKVFSNAGLLDDKLLSSTHPSHIMKQYDAVCDNNSNSTNGLSCDEIEPAKDIPKTGIEFIECTTLAEVEVQVFIFTYYTRLDRIAYVGRTFNICEDIGVDNSYCNFVPPPYSTGIYAEGQLCHGQGLECIFNQLNSDAYQKKEVVDAFLKLAPDITSLLNQHGFIPSIKQQLDALDPNPLANSNLDDLSAYGGLPQIGSNPIAKKSDVPVIGGLALPRLEHNTMRAIGEAGMNVWNHLSHGANLIVDKSTSAYPWRDSAWITSPNLQPLNIILTDPFFDNDPDKLPGYYNYLGPVSMPNYLKLYFNDTKTMNKLSAIRAKYDEIGLFDNPAYIPRGIDFGGSVNTCENKESSDDEAPKDNTVSLLPKESNGKLTEDEECNSVTELACGVEDFSTLCSLLSSVSGLVDDLSIGSWTLFAPNNDAFARLNDELDGGLVSISDELLKQILYFHAVDDETIYAGDLSCKTGENLIEMSNGKDARIKCVSGTPFGIKGNGNEVPAEFVDVDIEACNGIIHIIESVLLFSKL